MLLPTPTRTCSFESVGWSSDILCTPSLSRRSCGLLRLPRPAFCTELVALNTYNKHITNVTEIRNILFSSCLCESDEWWGPYDLSMIYTSYITEPQLWNMVEPKHHSIKKEQIIFQESSKHPIFLDPIPLNFLGSESIPIPSPSSCDLEDLKGNSFRIGKYTIIHVTG